MSRPRFQKGQREELHRQILGQGSQRLPGRGRMREVDHLLLFRSNLQILADAPERGEPQVQVHDPGERELRVEQRSDGTVRVTSELRQDDGVSDDQSVGHHVSGRPADSNQNAEGADGAAPKSLTDSEPTISS